MFSFRHLGPAEKAAPDILDDDSTGPKPSAERAGELIIQRPRAWSTGCRRRIRLDLDGRHVADLEPGDTARIRACEGPHRLRARCRPLITARLPIDLSAYQTVRLLVSVSAFGEVELDVAARA